MGVQQLLNDLYTQNWEVISSIRNRHKGLSYPLIIKCPESYLSQTKKLMVIGQETKGWGGKSDGSMQGLLDRYEEFSFGKNYYSSPFWNMARKLERSLDIERYAIIWGNLNRCDYNDGEPPKNITDDLMTLAHMLADEVKILKPNAVIFFSGPHYDEHIIRSFPGASFDSVEGFKLRSLSHIKHKLLPNHSYRTYHPNYLRRSGMEPKLIDFICKAIG